MKRELAAAVAIPIVLAVLFLAPPIVFNVLVAGVALAALWEFYRIAEKTGLPVAKTVGMIVGAAILLWWAAFWGFDLYSDRPGVTVAVAVLLVLVFLACVAPLFARVDLQSAIGGASGTVFGVLSVALPATAMCYLRSVSPRAVLFLFLIVWGCDSFAYYTGKNFGRRKLAPRVSPNKTWEGTIGGLVGGTLIGAAGGTWWLVPELGPVFGGIAGALASSAGQIGDLVESLWKRGAGLKDSGTFLPGHGGFYDRVDSLLFAGPVLMAVINLFIGASTAP
jgi:phosphatidate cytidylyltransferase